LYGIFNKFGILGYDLISTSPLHYSVIALYFDGT